MRIATFFTGRYRTPISRYQNLSSDEGEDERAWKRASRASVSVKFQRGPTPSTTPPSEYFATSGSTAKVRLSERRPSCACPRPATHSSSSLDALPGKRQIPLNARCPYLTSP